MSSAPLNPKRFRIAFSFAGEKRDFVAKVAALVAARFGEEQVLYDNFHEAEFAHADLAFDLPSLYKREADLIVAVFCPDYENKEWCGLEWRAIFSLIKEGSVKQIMLARFEHADGKGLHGLSGFIELDHKRPEEFVTLILQRLAVNEGKPRDHYLTDSKPPVIATIPPPSRHNLPKLQSFFGRDEHLKQIADAIAKDSKSWGILILGNGGRGKTWLAVKAAWDAVPGLFHRIVFVSAKPQVLDDDGLRPNRRAAAGWLDMLNQCAQALEQPEIMKSPAENRDALVLHAIAQQPTLLIFDNLETVAKDDHDAILSFLDDLAHDSKAIITTRDPFGNQEHWLSLPPLDETAALAMLDDLALHNPALARESHNQRLRLYHATGGNALLLRWTSGQIGNPHSYCTTIEDALAHLGSCPVGNDPLEFIFGDLLARFTDDELRIVATLSYPTQPIPPAAIAEISGVSKIGTGRALKRLTNRSIIIPQEGTQTYALMQMVAEFIRHARPEVVKRMGTQLAERAYGLINENGWQNHARFPELEAAWPGIVPALPLFLAGDNARLQIVCAALQTFLEFQGRWDEYLALSEEAEAVAIAAADHNGAGFRVKDIGYIHYLRQQADAVLACAERAAAHWAQGRAGARERAMAIRLRGIGHRLKGEYPAAITAYREVLELHRSLAAESEDMAISLNDLACAEYLSGDLAAAEKHYREALGMARSIGYDGGVATYTGNLASLDLDRENWHTAEILAREALTLSEEIHRQELIASNNGRLAQALVRQDNAAEALLHAVRAVNIFTHLSSPDLGAAQALLAECEAAARS